VPERDTSYIGVMVHDIVSSNMTEPYRLFSSRAENRMHLRPDNAARRLLPLSCESGLSRGGDPEHSARLESGAEAIREILSGTSVGGKRLKDLCRQPGFDIEGLAVTVPALRGFDAGLVQSVALDERYGGYVEKAFRRSREIERLSGLSLEAISDYATVSEISWEARESLRKMRPASLREAASVPGVRPSDLDGLLIHLLRKVPRGTTA
jgi:tRNA uridine 5-carboxymethylaminomethyl modification enzyme